MNSFGENPFELPNNTSLEDVLKKNLDHTKPLEMKTFKVDGKNKLFPFWTPVKSDDPTAGDYQSYMDAKSKALDIKKKEDNVGIVNPKDPSKTYEDGSLLDKIKGLVKSQNDAAINDNTGIVKSKSENMDSTKESTQVIDNDVSNASDSVVDKAAKSKTGVGAVTPKAEMGTQNVPKDAPKSTPIGDKGEMGVVKAKADMGKQNVPKDAPKNTPVGDKGNMGVVKPKSEVKAKPSAINFDKFKTNQITKTPFKK